ncbi:MAG: amino acid adenylation domain-containing protein [Methylococcaceae bacterium]|nr:amino acid adenylation domain-containing protein [Methylococcaceae bacterium]
MNDFNLLHDVFVRHAEQTPDAIALRCGNMELTYGELHQRSEHLAHYLQTLGVKPETLVALCTERSFDLLIGLLAILKAGGAYLPLDTDAPAERLSFIVADAKADIVLTQTPFADSFSAQQVICLDQPLPAFTVADSLRQFDDDPAQRLVYVIYTSGSTGKPKGVQVTHLNVARLLSATEHWFKFSAQDVWALFHSSAFDMSVWEIWGAWLYGARLVIVPYLVSRDPEQFYQLLVAEKITCLNQTPSAFLPLVRVDQQYAPNLLSLRFVSFGGEALNFKALEPWLLRHGEQSPRLINMYGITETTVHASYRPVTLADIQAGRSQLIGEPIPDLKLYLLDENLQEVGVDEVGEIYVAGLGVTRGYLYRPELNAERFIEQSSFSSGKLYKSGDLAKRLVNGDMEYIGRADTQVKLRGFRIELGEIEQVLTAHADVSETIVSVYSDGEHKHLVAYLVAREHAALRQQIQALAHERLPDYMVPTYYVLLAAMPLTVNGKIDRKALPAPDYSSSVVLDQYAAPRNRVETTLVDIWQQLLKIERIGIHDNFFQLGGDSILVIQVSSHAAKQGLKFAPKQLFLHQTIAELAQHIEQQQPQQAKASLQNSGDILLTPIQHWFFEQNFAQMHYWNQAVLLRLQTPLAPRLLEQALQTLYQQHANLRLRFTQDAGTQSWQVAANDAAKTLKLTTLDLSSFTPEEKAEVLQETAEQLQGDLNLQKGPLMRVALFKLAEGEQRLLIIIHHLVVDGVSWRLLLSDLSSACQQLQQQQLPQITEHNEYALWTQQLQAYTQSLDSIDFWVQQAQGAQGHLPVDLSGENSSASTRSIIKTFDVSTTQALLQHPYESLQDLLLSALFCSLADFTGHNKILIEMEGHGRESIIDADISHCCGWFTSLFPFAVECSSDAYCVLQAVKQQLQLLPANGLEYGLLRYLSAHEAWRQQLAALPQAEVVFNYLGQFDSLFDERALFTIANEDYGSVHSPKSQRAHVLEVEALCYQGQLRITLNYSAQRHKPSSIEKILSGIDTYLRELLQQTQQGDFALAQLSLADIAELKRQYPTVEALYPASATQAGMLFHALGDTAQDVYFEQLCYQLAGEMDIGLFKHAWELSIQQQQILRTCFVWKGFAQPLQAVMAQLPISWLIEDFSDLSVADSELKQQQLIQQDRNQVFVLNQAPLMRFILIKLPQAQYRFIWTHSHLLLDGWSVALLLKEVLSDYALLLQQQTVQRRPCAQYRDYIAWLIVQDQRQAGDFWREQLQDLQHQPLATEYTAQQGYADAFARVNEHTTQALQQHSKQMGVTLNGFIQAAWALVLAKATQVDDVLFGITVSGRSIPVPQIDQMAGLFINTLPLYLKLSADDSVLDLLKRIQLLQFSMQQYEYTALAEIQAYLGSPLAIDSLLVFENYPVDPLVSSEQLPLRIMGVKAYEHTNYPLTLLAIPSEVIALQMTYNQSLFSVERIDTLLQQLIEVLERISTQPDQKLAGLLLNTADSAASQSFLQASMELDEDF